MPTQRRLPASAALSTMMIPFSVWLSLSSATAYSMSETPVEPVETGQPEIVSDIVKETLDVAIIDSQKVNASHESIQTSGESLAIWQGMKHEWKRFIIDAKNGRIPHRISKLENYVSQDASNNQLTFNMGENTGVDGNYMYPKSHASILDVSALSVEQGKVSLNWSDSIINVGEGPDSYVPQAKNRIRYFLEIPSLPWQENRTSVFIQGVSLETRCSDLANGDTCNSDGMWPYLYHLSLDQCQESSIQGTQCQLNVNIYRSWTPNKGGFQLIGEVKPINQQLDFDLTVYYGGLSGSESNIAVSNVTTAKYEHELQDYDDNPQNVVLIGSGKNYNTGIAAITGFGFALTKPDKINAGWKMLGSDINQRGRYIARKQFEVTAGDYKQHQFMQNVSVNMGLWAPTTVVESDVITEMNLQLIELASFVDGSVDGFVNKSVEGKICINSKDAAPFFSKWKKCDKKSAAAIKKFGGAEKPSIEISVNLTE